MSRRPTHLPTTLADCHQLILKLHAELTQRELHAARLRDEVAARRTRSVTRTGVSGADRAGPSLSFHAVFPNESDGHDVS
jgi:hypothetical protein